MRNEFFGIMKMNPVTDRKEPIFTAKDRLARYFVSFFMCAPYFFAIFLYNICSLNLNGVIDPTRHHALFQIDILSDLRKPGAWFDPSTSKISFLPTIIQVTTSIFLNEAFKTVAQKSTELENHRTQRDFDNCLIIKRFAFHFFDYFLYLFYVGCYELRMDILRTYLGTLFTIDEIRRIMTETIIPYIMQWKAKRAKQALKKKNKTL